MKVVKFEEFMNDLDFFVQEAKNGKIFIYPTDTIYGIGWIWNEENIKKIADIKNRDWNKMFSVIAPNFEWIERNYDIKSTSLLKGGGPQRGGGFKTPTPSEPLPLEKGTTSELKEQLQKYHWVTWIFSYEKPGVRIIKHDFQKFVEKLWEWFITTSVNISWEPAVTNLEDLKPEIKEKVDYIIDYGICEGRPSVLIDFVKGEIIER